MRATDSLGADEAAHCGRVRERLTHAMAAGGNWLSFEAYMDLTLYAPGLGYYSAGSHKLGRGGDFTTAPEVSRLFGFCVARQCAEVLRECGGGSILEVGAGTGRLAVDLLTRLDSLDRAPDRYLILELSADLRERQQRLIADELPQWRERVSWLDALPDAPFDGVIVANEVVDALPVVRFRWAAGGCEELGVTSVDGEFHWAARPASPAMSDHCRALSLAAGGWDDGYVSEYCARLQPWASGVGRCLRRGAALWFDYGLPRAQYYIPERHEGTLLCHFRQRTEENPFRHPGLQDITAWVDFTSLAEASLQADCELAGFTTQALFLAGLEIDGEMRMLAAGDENAFARLVNQARQLMLPGEMGERFKAMAWTRGVQRDLSGFALRDLRHTL